MLALLGVSDKQGLVKFAQRLQNLGVDLVATDGTKAELEANGIVARSVTELTGVAEMLDGRVKTLHPAIHAGILARRNVSSDLEQTAQHNFSLIDIVVVSLYPFVETLQKGSSHEEIIENIDIGGPTMVRAAAKNHQSVTIVTSAQQYETVLQELQMHGQVTEATRKNLAAVAFANVAAYDTAVASYLAQTASTPSPQDQTTRDQIKSMPEFFTTGGKRLQQLRYGENPHQKGALYAVSGSTTGLAGAKQIQGPELSFTNWLDADASSSLVNDFSQAAAAVIKHTNPCGFAVGEDIVQVYQKAYECDPRAAFGGVVAMNQEIDLSLAEELSKTFLEVVIAPTITTSAKEVLAKKTRLRVLLNPKVANFDPNSTVFDVRSIDGGLLVQTANKFIVQPSDFKVVTKRQPTDLQLKQLEIAWRICRHVKSNAVVLVNDNAAVGVGAGQMSRVEAADLAIQRAAQRANGAVAASDAFFPMPDGLETLAKAGVIAVIQPGGSKKDPEVIAAADRLDIVMLTTGERHFRH